MFTNITEEDIRVNCPEYSPMTVSMMNKLSPLKVNNNVNPLNPFIERRSSPSSINQFVKTSGYQFNKSPSEAVELKDNLIGSVAARDVVSPFAVLGEEEEEKGGSDDDDPYRKAAPGEMSMAEIDEQIEILEYTLTNENISDEEFNQVILTLEYYENLKKEQGGGTNERPQELQSKFSTEATPLLTRSQVDMQEQEAEARVEARGDAPAEGFNSYFTTKYGTNRPVIQAVEIQPLPLPDVPGGRPSAADMRERALERESVEEQRMRLERLEAFKSKSSTLSPIQGPPPLP